MIESKKRNNNLNKVTQIKPKVILQEYNYYQLMGINLISEYTLKNNKLQLKMLLLKKKFR